MSRQAAVLALLCLGCATAREWTPKAYPNPTLDPAACNRAGIVSWVCDADKVLTKKQADTVEGILKEIAAPNDPFVGPDCPQLPPGRAGFQVGVAVMKKMALQGRTREEAAEDFAASLFQKWGVGEASCGNGAILLLSLEDRQVYIRTGKGRLSQEAIDRVIERMRPLLRNQQYGQALREGTVDLGIRLSRQAQGKSEHQRDYTPFALLAFLGGIGSLITWKSWKRRSDEGRVKSLLQRLQEDQNTARQQRRYPAASCPICFEDLQQPADQAASGPLRAAEPERPSAPPLAEASQAGPSSAPAEDDSALQNPLLSKDAAKRSEQGPEQQAGAGPKAPLALPCGHTFCQPCMETWLSSNRTCPVCRKPADRDHRGDDDDSHDTDDRPSGPPRRPPPPDPCSAQSGAQQAPFGRRMQLDDAMWQAELAYRLHGMHRMYPDVITTRTRDRWISQADAGQRLDMHWETVRQDMLSQAAQQRHASMGSSGQSYGFGGSQGGGASSGGGGSW